VSGGTPGRFLQCVLSGGCGRCLLTVAVHDAQHDGRDYAHGERDGEVVDDVGVLLPLVVADHGQRVVLSGIVTRERGTRHAVGFCEIGTGHGRRVTTALDVDQEHSLVHDHVAAASATGRHLHATATAIDATDSTGGRPVCHVNVTAVVHVAGASLPARAPRAVVQAGQLFAAHRCALHWFRHEVGQQR